MNFYNSTFLKNHAQAILDFYSQRCIDTKRGGYFQNYYDDGEIFNHGFRQLVSSTRMVVNFCRASIVLENKDYLSHAKHGLDYIEKHHWRESTQTYAWTLQDNHPLDMTQQAYGYAFVILCYAHCFKAGLLENEHKLVRTFELLESRFWREEEGLYADTRYEDGRLCQYRGQNANMHICESLIAAYSAIGNELYLRRAKLLAKKFCFELAEQSEGLIYEHFTPDLKPDFVYNKDDPKNLYRPWGFQPGHQTEWAKLLLQLNRYTAESKLVNKAIFLFDAAYQNAWDHLKGGLIYGFDQKLQPCDSDKYFWVQAESFAAAALLYAQTQSQNYLNCYNAIWAYCWQYFDVLEGALKA